LKGASEGDLVRWAESLAAIASTGLGFTRSLYERERFEEVMRIAGDIRAAAAELARGRERETGTDGDTGEPAVSGAEGYVEEWMRSVGDGVAGYVTPKLAVGAAVGNERVELLLIRRADSGFWLYPTGWADVGYSPAEVAVKEVREETGIEAVPVRLIAVFDSMRRGISRFPFYSLVFQCRAVGGELRAHPLECSEVGWFPRSRLPDPLAGGDRWVDHVFAALATEEDQAVSVLFDPPREPVWRGGAGPW
jgi:ADP-ribose pyrophosphatase YjhB (NUDIX family)